MQRNNIRTIVADPDPLNFCRFSHASQQYVKCPKVKDIEIFTEWLITFGEAQPGLYLYPNSDDLCWIIAKYGRELSKYYRFTYPDLPVIQSLLDKRSLYQIASMLGIAIPGSYELDDLNEIDYSCLEFPVILKPRIQVGLSGDFKNIIVRSSDEFMARLDDFRRLAVFHSELVVDVLDVSLPIVQKLYPSAQIETLVISGYISAAGEILGLRANSKQRVYPAVRGVDLCFESREVEDSLAEQLLGLCVSVGYFGVFLAEFIVNLTENKELEYLLVDFVPRSYEHLEFDIQRQLPIPLFYIFECEKQSSKLYALAKPPEQLSPKAPRRFRHRFMLSVLIGWQLLRGKRTFKQWQLWRQWSKKQGCDPIARDDDRWPLFFDMLLSLRQLLPWSRWRP